MNRIAHRVAAALGATALLGGCQPSPTGTGLLQPTSQPQLSEGAIIQAQRQVGRFDQDRQQGGMSAVAEDIQRCYRVTTRPPTDQLELRQCLVFDWFAYRLNREVDRQVLNGGNLPFFRQRAIEARISRFGPLAGFSDPEVLGGYLAQGSNTMFAVLASRVRR